MFKTHPILSVIFENYVIQVINWTPNRTCAYICNVKTILIFTKIQTKAVVIPSVINKQFQIIHRIHVMKQILVPSNMFNSHP